MTPSRREFLLAAIATAAAATFHSSPPERPSFVTPETPLVYREWVYVEAEIEEATKFGDSFRHYLPTGILRFDLSCGHSIRVGRDAAKAKEYERVPCYECSFMERLTDQPFTGKDVSWTQTIA